MRMLTTRAASSPSRNPMRKLANMRAPELGDGLVRTAWLGKPNLRTRP